MKEEKDISLIQIIIKVITITVSAAPTISITYLILGIMFGTSFGLKTLVTQNFFDGVNSVLFGNISISKIVILALILGGVTIISELLNFIYSFVFSACETKVSGVLNKKINEKISKLEPIMFEDPTTLNDINKSKKGVDGILGLFVVIAMLSTFYLPYLLFMTVYLFKLDKLLAISLILIFVPVFFTQLIRVKIFNNLENKIAPIRRECDYYEKCICSREYFKETRLLGAFSYFKNLHSKSMELWGKNTWDAEKKTGLIELSMKILTLLGYIGVLFLLCNSLLNQNITIGAFAAVFNSIGFMIIMMEEIICVQIGKLTREFGAVTNFFKFFDLKERDGKNLNISSNDGIFLKNVSFTYPLSKNPVLKNISLKIYPKEIIAIVGENGSGKSTLIKIITGLYLPNKGTVEFGDTNTSDVSLESIYKNTSAVFQKYKKYQMNLSENIMISNVGKNSLIDLEDASKKADLDSTNFPDGYNTMLSREFDGIDLSGGQWQKIAIARGFYRPHDLVVLDEPTAAIDPLEETKLYEKFSRLSKGKTSIIVTHRIGSAKIANRIIVMDKGTIVEMGTHNELININGKYREMYKAQAKWYERD